MDPDNFYGLLGRIPLLGYLFEEHFNRAQRQIQPQPLLDGAPIQVLHEPHVVAVRRRDRGIAAELQAQIHPPEVFQAEQNAWEFAQNWPIPGMIPPHRLNGANNFNVAHYFAEERRRVAAQIEENPAPRPIPNADWDGVQLHQHHVLGERVLNVINRLRAAMLGYEIMIDMGDPYERRRIEALPRIPARNPFTAFTDEEIDLIENCQEITDEEKDLCECPISYKIMRFPVLSLDDNMIYDKACILATIRQNLEARGAVGIRLRNEDLIPVRSVFQKISKLLDKAKAIRRAQEQASPAEEQAIPEAASSPSPKI